MKTISIKMSMFKRFIKMILKELTMMTMMMMMMMMVMIMMAMVMEPESPSQFLLMAAFGTNAESQHQLPSLHTIYYYS